MIYVAIDPGLNGGICVLDNEGNVIHLYKNPIIDGLKKEYDINQIVKIFEFLKSKYPEITAFLERAAIIPMSGSKSVASTFFCNGIFQGTFASLKIPYQIVRAKDWQSKLFVGMNHKDTKQASILFCNRKFPNIDFKRTERCKNDDDGLTDATCIAYYGFLQHTNQQVK